jgi:hypothetical protein
MLRRAAAAHAEMRAARLAPAGAALEDLDGFGEFMPFF